MLNLILIFIPFLIYYLPDYVLGIRIEYAFYPALYCVISVLRYRYNRVKWLLVLGVSGGLLLPFYYLVPFSQVQHIFLFQVALVITSTYYTFRNKLWKKDFIFAIIEPALIPAFGVYFVVVNFPDLINIAPLTFLYSSITRWALVYGVVQLILVFSKLTIGLRYALILDSDQPRFKLLAYCLPKIEASFGINDLAFVTGTRFVPSTTSDRALKQFSSMATRFNSLTKNGTPSAGEGKRMNRKKSNYR